MRGRILAVAGSDSSGGAGIEADIKTATALGAYAATAITALTVQNTHGIDRVMPVPSDFVAQAMAAVLRDIGADAIKTGMLVSATIVAAVVEVIEEFAPSVPLVVDPVMMSSSGTRLLSEDAIDVLKRRLIPRATVITPNISEAEVLSGQTIADVGAMKEAAVALLKTGPRAVVITGSHLAGPVVSDVICDAAGVAMLEGPRLGSQSLHGTGCTFATAIAASLAQGMALRSAVARAQLFVRDAIAAAPGFGSGNGPLNHLRD
jgi:hydroxymethylpyrimidine/phosphomethylpyrimidine kinase